MSSIKSCILIPTYNNINTLADIIEDVKGYNTNIIVVNDGSTDKTIQVLSDIGGITIISYSNNKGKGYALRVGFKKARKLGFTHAITIDSDGQHKAKDIPLFEQAIHKEPRAIFIGSRNMKQENVPSTSSFGNTFSSFWFKLETGISLNDTQSGYRSYPLHEIKNIPFYTNKYEFEIEVLVRSAWYGIPIKEIAIDVYYPPKEERVSHFRKIPDFTRISLLNTLFVAATVFYIKPRNLFRSLKKKDPKTFLKKHLIANTESTSKILSAVFLGTFIGLSPFHGIKMASVITLSFFLKLNKPLAIGFSYVSGMPPIIPFLIGISHQIGAFVLQNGNYLSIASFKKLSVNTAFETLYQQLIGGLVLAVIGASLTTLITVLFLVNKRKK